MDKKTLILLLSVLGAMILLVGTAVAVLYSGTYHSDTEDKIELDGDLALLSAVPSDAVLVANFTSVSKLLPFYDFPAALAEQENLFSRLSSVAVSLHYSGSLVPLYIFDTGRASAETSQLAAELMDFAGSRGYFSEYIDGTTQNGLNGRLTKRELVLVSPSSTVLKASLRHIERSVSVLDINGFPEAVKKAGSSDVLAVSNLHFSKFVPAVLSGKYGSESEFMSSLSDWTAFDITKSDESNVVMRGQAYSDNAGDTFLSLFAETSTAVSTVDEVLPDYTVFAASLPVRDLGIYRQALESYMDSCQKLAKYKEKLKLLSKQKGISPETYFNDLKLSEIATATFKVGNKLEKVNLMKVKTKEYKDSTGVHEYGYSGFASALFGALFNIGDESFYTCRNGWIVCGSREAVEEYSSGRAMEYTLKNFMSDNSRFSLSGSPVRFVAYSSLGHTPKEIFSKNILPVIERMKDGADYVPVVFSVGKQNEYNFAVQQAGIRKTKAPKFERDTSVNVPKGPFDVKNSGTGKMNKFYQQDNNYLCLSENGKPLWAVEFATPICGTAVNIDYFANGKLQILFGSTSKIYAIDRLGRMVSGFPVDLKKEILLGPGLYDFSGNRKYNVMVLHKDNTVSMYNLKGTKPAAWKDITAKETIKSLPEKIELGNSTFWVVRTSLQTLIFPFMGGETLTSFEGDKMIRPDSEIKVIDNESVEVTCYDGKQRIVKLK